MALHVPGYLSPSRSDSYYSEVHYSSVRSKLCPKDVLSQHSWITQLCECFSVFLCERTCIPACIFMTCYLIHAPHIAACVCVCVCVCVSVNGGSVVWIMLFIIIQNSFSYMCYLCSDDNDRDYDDSNVEGLRIYVCGFKATCVSVRWPLVESLQLLATLIETIASCCRWELIVLIVVCDMIIGVLNLQKTSDFLNVVSILTPPFHRHVSLTLHVAYSFVPSSKTGSYPTGSTTKAVHHGFLVLLSCSDYVYLSLFPDFCYFFLYQKLTWCSTPCLCLTSCLRWTIFKFGMQFGVYLRGWFQRMPRQ